MENFKYYTQALQNYSQFSGRATRLEFWYFTLFNLIILLILDAINFGLFPFVYVIALLMPSLAISVRRLHDVGNNGWMLLVGLIPFLGIIWLIYLLAQDSQSGDNQFGKNPKSNDL